MHHSDVTITGEIMPHSKGVWAGTRPSVWTAVHNPTGVSISWSDYCDASQHTARKTALACLELMIEMIGAEDTIDFREYPGETP